MDKQEIKQLKVFRELKTEEFERFYSMLQPVHVIEGEELIKQEAQAHRVFILLKGHLMIHYKDGRATTVSKRGSILGWSALTTPFRYTGYATALTDGELLCIPRAKFLELVQSDAVLGEKLTRKINEIVAKRNKESGL